MATVTPNPSLQFVAAITDSAKMSRQAIGDSTLLMRLSLGPMTQAEQLVLGGFDPVVNFGPLAQQVLNHPDGGDLGLAYLYFYAGVFDSPPPARLFIRADRIFQGAVRLREEKIFSVSALAAEHAAGAFAQINFSARKLAAEHLARQMTYASMPWWPAWNAQAFRFPRRTLRKAAITTLQRKTMWTLWAYATDYWMSAPRTLIAALIPAVLLGFAYASIGVSLHSHVVHGVGQAMYLSGLAITTLGFGGVAPHGIGQVLAVAEGVYGMLVFALVAVLFARRYVG